MADVDDDEQHDAEHEQRADEVVQVFHQRGNPRKQRVTDHRQDDVLAEQNHQPRNAQHAKTDGHAPVRATLYQREALDEPT